MPSFTDNYSLLQPEHARQQSYIRRITGVLVGFLLLFSIAYLISFAINYNTKYVNPSILACTSPKYDYNLLALRWTPTFCSNKKCINPRETWDIHGLWPNWNNGTEGPEFCCKTWYFSSSELTTIIPEMKEEWPNQLANKSQESLWKHEWDKHGTCSTLAHTGGMVGYFNTTLNLFEQYPIQSWLTEQNITATNVDDKLAYTKDQIHRAIENHTNKKISLQCIKSKQSKSPLLFSIYFCFESSSMKLIDCPPDKCESKKVILPKVIQS